MIFFCEDCGEKNDLREADFKNDRAVFRCCSCQYLNSYPVFVPLKQTDILFEKIQSTPGIIGVFLYHGRNHTITNHMPGVLKEADLEVLGRYLTGSYLAAQSQYSDIHEVVICIGDKHITINRVESDLFVLVVSKTFPLPDTIQDLLISAEKKG